MKAILIVIKWMVKAFFSGLMEEFITAISLKERRPVKEYSCGQAASTMKVSSG
jgi:hypothetical protein